MRKSSKKALVRSYERGPPYAYIHTPASEDNRQSNPRAHKLEFEQGGGKKGPAERQRACHSRALEKNLSLLSNILSTWLSSTTIMSARLSLSLSLFHSMYVLYVAVQKITAGEKEERRGEKNKQAGQKDTHLILPCSLLSCFIIFFLLPRALGLSIQIQVVVKRKKKRINVNQAALLWHTL